MVGKIELKLIRNTVLLYFFIENDLIIEYEI